MQHQNFSHHNQSAYDNGMGSGSHDMNYNSQQLGSNTYDNDTSSHSQYYDLSMMQ